MDSPTPDKQASRGGHGRGALGLALVIFLLAIGAVPVLAAQAPNGQAGEAKDAAPPRAPSPAEVAAVEQKEHEEEEWLSSPEAVRERQSSTDAFAEISAGEAQNLLVESFPEAMAALNEDPGRVITGLEVEKPLGT